MIPVKQYLKVLVINDDEFFAENLKQYLAERGYNLVFGACGADSAREIIRTVKPHVVVSDIWLDGMSIYNLMKEARKENVSVPAFVFCSRVENEPVCRELCKERGTSYVLSPCSNSAIEKLVEKEGISLFSSMFDALFSDERNLRFYGYEQTEMEKICGYGEKYFAKKAPLDILEDRVTELMQSMGIPAKLKGYGYIRSAVIKEVLNGAESCGITKDIYPYVAKQFDTTPSRVERAIRHAVESAWMIGNHEVIEKIFINRRNRDFYQSKPANSEFIAVISDMLRLEFRHSGLFDCEK